MSFDTTICDTSIELSPELIYRTTDDNLLTGLTLSVVGPVVNGAQIRLTSVNDSNMYLVGSAVNFSATDDTDLTFDLKVWRVSSTLGTSAEWYVSTESLLLNAELSPVLATAGANAYLSIFNNPALVFHQNLVMAKTAKFDVEEYFVADGWPVALDGYGARLEISASIGTNQTNKTRPQFYDVDMESDSRWVATPDTYVDGLSWYPYSGSDRTPLIADPVNSPVLVTNYTRQFGSAYYDDYAMLFSDGEHFSLSSPFTQKYLTVIMACTFNSPEGQWYGLLSSGNQNAINTDESSNLSLRYHSNGTLELHFIDEVATLRITTFNIGSIKPIVVGFSIAVEEKTAKLLSIDASGRQHIETVTLPDFLSTDSDLFVGASPSRNNALTADINVFEINQYVRELSDQEISDYMAKLSRIYGVVS